MGLLLSVRNLDLQHRLNVATAGWRAGADRITTGYLEEGEGEIARRQTGVYCLVKRGLMNTPSSLTFLLRELFGVSIRPL